MISQLHTAPVTLFKPGNLICSCCGRMFRSDFALDEETEQPILEANSFRDPALFYAVHSCSFCNFSGTYDAFNGNVRINEDVKQFVLEDMLYMINGPEELAYASVRYYASALIAARIDETPSAVAQLYLNAARCCVVAGDRNYEYDERKYRKAAIWYFNRAIETNSVARRCQPFYSIVVALEYCRLGKQREWRAWLKKARSEALPNQLDSIIELANEQRYEPSLIPEEDYIFQKTDTPCCS